MQEHMPCEAHALDLHSCPAHLPQVSHPKPRACTKDLTDFHKHHLMSLPASRAPAPPGTTAHLPPRVLVTLLAAVGARLHCGLQRAAHKAERLQVRHLGKVLVQREQVAPLVLHLRFGAQQVGTGERFAGWVGIGSAGAGTGLGRATTRPEQSRALMKSAA